MKKIQTLTLVFNTLLISSCASFPSSSSSNSLSLTSSFSSLSSSISSESSLPSSVESSSSISESSSNSSASSLTSSVYTYDGYYASLQGLEDHQLKPTLTTKLRSILGSNNLLPSSVTYGNSRYALADTDVDPNNSNNLILVYRQTSVPKTWDAGATWNREHVFPQSKLGVETSNTSRHEGADYHNLKPANPSENSSRNNKYFDITTTSSSYAPPDVVKGDIARILFYMVTMYPHLSLVNLTSGAPSVHQMAQFSILMQWHQDDPVDAFELNRNNVIFQYQGNRNPYIDHPELTCRIFKTQLPPTSTACQA